MSKIEELEQKLNECQKALAELKESKKESKDKIFFSKKGDN
jgi:prefoldin subunit 5